MGEIFDTLPENIQTHLRSVIETSGLPVTEESYELLAENWAAKKTMFEQQIKALGMEEAAGFSKDDKRPAILLTYSGSLIAIGPVESGETGQVMLPQGMRAVEYASIKLRTDVPSVVSVPETSIEKDIRTDAEVFFTAGKIKQTSSLIKIGVCPSNIPIGDQADRVREVMIFLTNGFTKANRSISLHEGEKPDNFTLKSIIRYIASKNNITQKSAGLILDDFFFVLESGMLLGERVPLGRIGKLFLKKRAARKARITTKPGTDEELLVIAKPEMFVPKISFSKMIKEKAELAKIDDADIPSDDDDEPDEE